MEDSSNDSISQTNASLRTPKMLEILEDRLYLAAFAGSPPSKLSDRYCFFTIQDLLVYNPFFHDFGPFNIAHLYRFALILHDILSNASKNKDRAVVFYSKNDPKSRANAACLLACYMVLIQEWPPHLALTPLYDADEPFLSFRDAGYALADYVLSLQDVVYGVWRAHDLGLLNVRDLNLEQYEEFERVENGDLNWISKYFLAFASPIQPGFPDVKPDSILPRSFQKVIDYFTDHNVKAVVRLNNPLYDKKRFIENGIEHYELNFDDGTVPSYDIVRKFFDLSDEIFNKYTNASIAVHCKAGLGRTGCLIGAYLIYQYGFTANEVMAYMRFLRPGMVVGPQQHWLHINQQKFRAWYFERRYNRKSIDGETGMRPLAREEKMFSTPSRSPLSEVKYQNRDESPLPAPTAGQPRKTEFGIRNETDSVNKAMGVSNTAHDATKDDLIPSSNEQGRHIADPKHDSNATVNGRVDTSPLKIGRFSNPRRPSSMNTANQHVRSTSGIRNVSGGISSGRISKSRIKK